MRFFVLQDGWIKIPAADYRVGKNSPQTAGRLLLGLNQLVVKIHGATVLVDAGLGDKWQPGDLSLPDWERPRKFHLQLRQHNLEPDEITHVIYTHLHYDHIGGGTQRLNGGSLAPTFTNALYYVQQRELDFALSSISQGNDDFHIEDIDPLLQRGVLQALTGEAEILPGVTVHPAPGHTPGHQVVLFRDKLEALFFPGDLVSTREHLNIAVSMIYDKDVPVLFQERLRWMERARDWKWFFCHAIRAPIGEGAELWQEADSDLDYSQ